MCIKFGSWARNNCAKYCGYCFTYETVTSVTVNNIRYVPFQSAALVKIKPSQNGEITLSFTEVNHPLGANLNMANMFLWLFTKIKFLRKFLNFQYIWSWK